MILINPKNNLNASNSHLAPPNRLQILHELHIEQLTDLVNEMPIHTEAIFRSGLSVSGGISSGRGYQSTMGEFVNNLQDMASHGGISTMCSPVNIDFECSEVDQLWSEVEGVIKLVNVLISPFLSLFGSVEGNGISPFARDFSSAITLSICKRLKLSNGFKR